jgi:hypothetical protein
VTAAVLIRNNRNRYFLYGPLLLPRHPVTKHPQEAVFSVGSFVRLYNEDQRSKRTSRVEVEVGGRQSETAQISDSRSLEEAWETEEPSPL